MSCCPTNPQLPAKVTAGLSFSAVIATPANPAPDWSVTLYLRGPKNIDIDATASGTDHKISAASTDTATWPAGEYWYSLRAHDDSDAVELETGTITVLPDIVAAPVGFDGRSEARIALDAINAVLARRATIDQERYRINNRELYRTSIADLLKLRSFYAAQVRKECAQKTGSKRFGRTVAVRFS